MTDKESILKKIEELKLTMNSNPDFMSIWHLGRCYEDIGDLDSAIPFYERAAKTPHGWGADQYTLFSSLEGALSKRPNNPNLHIALGLTCQRAFVKKADNPSRSELAQAEVEFRQAIVLSPGHKNSEAEELLEALRALKEQADKRAINDERTRMFIEDEDLLKQGIKDLWTLHEHAGFLLTRCLISVDQTGKVRSPARVIVSSGSPEHDECVRNAIQNVPYAKYRDLNFFGEFDFACWSEDNKKCVAVLIRHRVSFPN